MKRTLLVLLLSSSLTAFAQGRPGSHPGGGPPSGIPGAGSGAGSTASVVSTKNPQQECS